jgi:hypothetical protein
MSFTGRQPLVEACTGDGVSRSGLDPQEPVHRLAAQGVAIVHAGSHPSRIRSPPPDGYSEQTGGDMDF